MRELVYLFMNKNGWPVEGAPAVSAVTGPGVITDEYLVAITCAAIIEGAEGACGQWDVAMGGVGLRCVDVELDEPTYGTADCVL
ncbi:hypothetical protein [Streptomyces sp. NPDC059008]|uniref:hypothetical protein n=1 Tax=unclassified Streptomyces TaxID=2593676 RepID=UPI00368C955A